MNSDSFAFVALPVACTAIATIVALSTLAWFRRRAIAASIHQLSTDTDEALLALSGYLTDNPKQVARHFGRIIGEASKRALIANNDLCMLEAIGAEPDLIRAQVQRAIAREQEHTTLLFGYAEFRDFVGRQADAKYLPEVAATL